VRRGWIASSVGASIGLSCRLAPLKQKPSGVPRASVTTWRFVPGLPLSVGFGPVAEPLFWPGQTHCPGSPGSSRFARPRADAPAAPDAGALDARLLPVAQTPPATHPAATAHLGPAAYPRAGPSTARTGCRSARPGSRSGDDRPSGVVGAVAEAGRSRPRDHRAEAGEPYQPTHAQTIRARSVRRSKAQSLCVANAPNLDWRPGFRSLFQKPRTFFYR
jgi:hypothetical protein